MVGGASSQRAAGRSDVNLSPRIRVLCSRVVFALPAEESCFPLHTAQSSARTVFFPIAAPRLRGSCGCTRRNGRAGATSASQGRSSSASQSQCSASTSSSSCSRAGRTRRTRRGARTLRPSGCALCLLEAVHDLEFIRSFAADAACTDGPQEKLRVTAAADRARASDAEARAEQAR